MHTLLLVFEFLGTTELLVIAVVALILFGPRKLPEIGRTVGRGIAEFKRASDDFKRTWEYEVEIDRRQKPADDPAPVVHESVSGETAAAAALPSYDASAGDFDGSQSQTTAPEPTVARGAAGRTADKDDDELNAS